MVFKGAPKNTAGISIEDGCLYLLCHTDVSPDKKDNGLTDYKIYCFNGEAKLLMVATDRFSVGNTKFDYFARNGKWLELVWGNPRSETEPKLDVDIEELFKFAEKLSTGIPHVRVDLYYVAGKICFGEMTLYDASGFAKFESDSWDEMLGEWIELGGVIDDIAISIRTTEKPVRRELIDYKFYCFKGVPSYCQVIGNRSNNETIDFFDMKWKHQEFTGLGLPHKPFSKEDIPRPITFEDMKTAATVLSAGTMFLHVDFYEVNGKMLFGEMTFYPASGFGIFEPERWNALIGNMINLQEE